MNEKILPWMYDDVYASTKTELGFAIYIMDQFAKVSGWAIQKFLGRIFMEQAWNPKANIDMFFKNISQALIKEFNIEDRKTSDIKYYI